MDQKKSCGSKQDSRSEDNESRAQSQDTLDTSSASSLSFFADHTDSQNNCSQANELSTDEPKSGECSPSRQPMDEALKSEKAFIEFVMSLPPKEHSEHHHRSADSVTIPKPKIPTAAGSSTTKVGLDHLDNLCKLMEQLSELRDTNNKLQRRVQYLEDLKTLHDMHKEISDETQYSSEDALTNRPRPYELKKSATETCCPKKDDTHAQHPSRHHSKYQSRRGRTQSADCSRRERSKSVGHEDAGEDTKSKRIFPKWSKVKEAFGWESERKESVKIKSDGDARSVGVPRRRSDDSHQSFQPSKSPTWSHDYPSLHSSLEDVHEILDAGRWKRTSVASEKNAVYLDTPKEALRRQKSTPSPGSEKIITYREVSDLKPKSSTIERDTYSPQEFSKFDKDDGKRGKSPWGRVKTIIERRRDSLKRRSLRREHACSECESTLPQKTLQQAGEVVKGPADFSEFSSSHPSESQSRLKHRVPDPIVIDEEVDYAGPRTPSSSPTFHRKSRWTRVKKALTGKREDDRDASLSTPASPNSAQDGHFTFDATEEISQDAFDDSHEIKRVGSDSHVHQLALSAPACDLMVQLQRNLSEDFHKKIMEWERIRSSGNTSCSPQWDRKPSIAIRSRKKSEREEKNIKPKLKDLTWLEKELQKIEKEKQRLSKERQKYEERALRLEKLKETVLNANSSNKREVFVRTSAGEFRFEGISDAFTKKLYEWETKRGVGPELSTIALLDSSRLTVQSAIGPKSGPLQRVVSRSESSIADIGQPSHNSSNSLPSLKVADSVDVERTNQPSRANSEPDLSTLVALTNGCNVSASNLSRQVGDSLDDELTSPGVSRESEEEVDKRRNDSETYYGLLEENVILLEQLKGKEEICNRLEKELEVLDKKVDVMDKHHSQETERYREKLWEMHKPGATPRDVQCCLRTMAQLRKRIEVLEKCMEKVRNDRESVEDSFRYHSKQQEDMTLDLLQKMSELQAAGSSTAECDSKEYIPTPMDVSVVERLQDLSALLIKQTQDLQETLSAKSRQICQLRWELLHRDLSTVKLETELHTHNAHRKRSKYAHYRSHSSEEASSVVLVPQELDCEKSAIITDAYYNATSFESEFQATELTNTVQQLKKEVLKLANATEYPDADQENCDPSSNRTNKEKSWTKIGSKIRDKAKQITVRRSSADNLSGVWSKDEVWKSKKPCSSDSDNSSDDAYTKINLRPGGKGCFPNPNAERLLMSSGEHPPRGYLQRRKKLQKTSKSNTSPNRRRSNTFHIKREYEKPHIFQNIPQKCFSFRYPTEKTFAYSNSRTLTNPIDIRNLLGEVKYQEFLKKKAQMCFNNSVQTILMNKQSLMMTDGKPGSQLLRDVASDSKIPFLTEVRYRTDPYLQSALPHKYPVRSMSEKQKREQAAERREHFRNRKNKKHLTSPDLLSGLNEALKVRILAMNSFQQKLPKRDFDQDFKTKTNSSSKQNETTAKDKSSSNIPLSATDAATVTVQLPKRKSRKASSRGTDISIENTEETFTIVIPKKRSLSSEQEFEATINSTSPLSKELSRQKLSQEGFKGQNLSNSTLSQKDERTCTIKNSYDTQVCANTTTDFLKQDAQNEQLSRKRKAEESDSHHKNNLNEIQIKPLNVDDMSNQSNSDSDFIKSEKLGKPPSLYIKSPSAPHLDWRKACAKKISRERAPNVKLLIDKYNKVAEGQSLRSPNSSNLSSPTYNRKISAPLCVSRSDRSITSYSFSTPTTPSIVSASAFYHPLTFRPLNLDLFPSSPPSSPQSEARSEAIKRAKEEFISSQTLPINSQGNDLCDRTCALSSQTTEETSVPEKNSPVSINLPLDTQLRVNEDDRTSNYSMDSMSLVMFKTGETCQESRLSKRSTESRGDTDTLERRNNLKTSKSLSNSSIFKAVLNSDFKMPSSLMKLKRSKRKKDMGTVTHLCRQSLLLTTEDTRKLSTSSSHKSCPSSPELKAKHEVKSNWFQRNIFRHK